MTTTARTRFRRFLLAMLGAALAVAGVRAFVADGPAAPPAPDWGREVVDRVLPLAPGGVVELQLSGERVELQSGSAAGVRVVITADSAARGGERPPTYRLESTARGVSVRADALSSGAASGVTVKVWVPRDARVRHAGTTGDVAVDKLDGDEVALATTSGDVGIGEVLCNRLQVTTASGDVVAMDARGTSVQVQTETGDVGVRRSSGGIEIASDHGDVRLLDHGGHVALRAGTGRVVLGVRDRVSPTQIDTGSGDVEVRLAGDARADLDVDTRGRVRVGDALDFTGRTAGGAALGRLGTGGAPLEIRSRLGDVELQRRPGRP